MTPSAPTSTTTPARDGGRTPQTPGEMLQEVMELTSGGVVALMPLLLLAMPAIALFVILPAILLLAVAVPLAVIGALLALPPYLAARWLRRHRRRTTVPPAGHAGPAPRPVTTSSPRRARRLAHG